MTTIPTISRYTPDQVAQLHGVCVETVHRRCASGAWPHHRNGRRRYFTDTDLVEIDALAYQPATAEPTTGRTAGSAAYHSTPAPTSGRKSRIR